MISAARFPEASTAELPGAGGTMRRIAIKAGHVAARHHHDFEQFLYVVSGGGRLACEGGAIVLEAGVGLNLPAGAWHSAEFTADTVLLEVNMVEGSG